VFLYLLARLFAIIHPKTTEVFVAVIRLNLRYLLEAATAAVVIAHHRREASQEHAPDCYRSIGEPS